MKKKTAGILVGIMISAAIFSGCGNNEATEAASESAETEKEGNGEDAETEEAIQKAEEETKKQENSEEESEEETGEKPQEYLGNVGILLPDESVEKYAQDGKHLTEALLDEGYQAEVLYADGDASIQADQVQQMVEKQVNALIILPTDRYGLSESLTLAKEAGIPVFSYDELIMDSDGVKYYTTFDTREIGQMLGNAVVKEKDLEKAREEKLSYSVEFLMGSPDDTASLFLYNGVMEVLSPYLEDGTLICQSQKTTFEDTGILRWSRETAKNNLSEILDEFYQDKKLDMVICAFDDAALGTQEALTEKEILPGSEEWPLITGVGCEAEAVKAVAEGKQTCSIFMDRRVLAEKCVDMVVALLKGEDPEVKDYEQYDNGKKIIGTYTCDVQMIDKDNYEILIDNGYYTEEQVKPEEIPTPTPVEEEITPTPKGIKKEEKVTPTPEETNEQPTPTPTESAISASI